MGENETIQATFSCEITPEKEVRIHWDTQHVVTLTGDSARRMIYRLESMKESESVALMEGISHRFPLTPPKAEPADS